MINDVQAPFLKSPSSITGVDAKIIVSRISEDTDPLVCGNSHTKAYNMELLRAYVEYMIRNKILDILFYLYLFGRSTLPISSVIKSFFVIITVHSIKKHPSY